jgi:peroxiredoxin
MINLIALWLVVLSLAWLFVRVSRMVLAERERAANVPARRSQPDSLVGQPAPAFVALTLDQRQVSRQDYLGVETLFFFLSTTCPHCRNAVPEIERVGEKVLRRGGKAALVFRESAEKARAYSESLGLKLEVLTASEAIVNDYNRKGGVPAFVALNREGIVIHEGVVNRAAEAWRALVNEWQAYPTLTRSAALYRL